MTDTIKRLEAQINRMTTDGEVEQAAIDEIERLRTAILKVKEHLRNAERGVLSLGLRDNAKSRAALKELFDMVPDSMSRGGTES